MHYLELFHSYTTYIYIKTMQIDSFMCIHICLLNMCTRLGHVFARLNICLLMCSVCVNYMCFGLIVQLYGFVLYTFL